MARISPCKTCFERFPGCHDMCKNYLDWKQADKAARVECEKQKHRCTIGKHSILGDYHMPNINGQKRK